MVVPILDDRPNGSGQLAILVISAVHLVEGAAAQVGGVGPAVVVGDQADLGQLVGIGLIGAPLAVQGVKVLGSAAGLVGVRVSQGDAVPALVDGAGLDDDDITNANADGMDYWVALVLVATA